MTLYRALAQLGRLVAEWAEREIEKREQAPDPIVVQVRAQWEARALTYPANDRLGERVVFENIRRAICEFKGHRFIYYGAISRMCARCRVIHERQMAGDSWIEL